MTPTCLQTPSGELEREIMRRLNSAKVVNLEMGSKKESNRDIERQEKKLLVKVSVLKGKTSHVKHQHKKSCPGRVTLVEQSSHTLFLLHKVARQ